MTPREIANAIVALTDVELMELNQILREEAGEDASVRVPRSPVPPTDAARSEVDLPADYWETAQ